MTLFFPVQCIIKYNYYYYIRSRKGLSASASADNPYLDLDYSGYDKNLIQELVKNGL